MVKRPVLLITCALASAFSWGVMAAVRADEDASDKNSQRDRDRVLRVLRLRDPEIVERALDTLGRTSPQRILSVKGQLIVLADHESPDVRRLAIQRLGDIGPPAADALPLMVARLEDPDGGVRAYAAEAVWLVGQRADLACPTLLQALTSDDARQSFVAVYALKRMGPAAAIVLDAITKLMDDPRARVRRTGAALLGALGPTHQSRSVPLLLAALDDAATDVRIEAARGLNAADGPLDQAIAELSELISAPPSPDAPRNGLTAGSSVASSAAEALGEFAGDAAPATACLGRALQSPLLAVRLEAATALGRMGPAASEAMAALSEALRETKAHSVPFAHRAWCVGDNAGRALEAIGVASAPTLVEALEDADADVRASAARALGGVSEAAGQTVGPLTNRLRDANPMVRIEAAKSLGRLGSAATSAAPTLSRLLLDSQAFTFFRSGSGIGDKESVRGEALQALLRIGPSAEQVWPGLVASLARSDEVTYEAIAALRHFHGAPNDTDACQAQLARLLGKPDARAAAACAMTIVKAEFPNLREILHDNLIDDEMQIDPFAAIGLGQLAEVGQTFDADFRQRLRELEGDTRKDLFLRSCLLRMSPDDRPTADALVAALRSSHAVFQAIGIRESERTLRELVHHPTVKQTLLDELDFVVEFSTRSEHARLRDQTEARLRAARILVAAQVELPTTIACLAKLARSDITPVQGDAADLLAQCRNEAESAMAVLARLLNNDGSYVVDGDFYGNGGRRRVVGERAAAALGQLRAFETLHDHLDDPDPSVRRRVVRTLGDLGAEGVTDRLLERARDADHRVRRQTMATLGRIGRLEPRTRTKIRETLVAASHDQRRSVRDEASRSLARWK